MEAHEKKIEADRLAESMYNNGHGSGSGHNSMYNNGHGSGSGHDSMHHDQHHSNDHSSMYNNGHGSGSGHDSMYNNGHGSGSGHGFDFNSLKCANGTSSIALEDKIKKEKGEVCPDRLQPKCMKLASPDNLILIDGGYMA